MIVKDPYGVVLIIAPWNYPVNLVLLPLIPALAAGNTVIIKPSELAPHTAAVITDIVQTYFDPQNVAVVCGGATETTNLLKERFDYIFYTGGPSVAKIIMTAAAKNLTPVTFELGGKCPVVIEDDADIEKSVKRIAWGKWLNCGQTCLAPDYILVKEALKPLLLDTFCRVIEEFYGKNAQESPDYSRIINERHFDRLKELVEATNGRIVYKGGEFDRSDLFVPPIVADVDESDILMKDELFGPILPVVTVNDLDDAIRFINSREKPLAAYLFTKSNSNVERFYTETSSGGVCINDVILHLAVDTLPFGGVGNSGLGQYRGKFGFDTFSHQKAMLQRGFFSEKLTAARYPPLTKEKFDHLKALTSKRRGLPRWLKKYCPALPIFLLTLILCLFLRWECGF
uniref:Aldehyde dehydrogenase n=1 Tax=Syphacia muris TaxID=451379 RepID=A0A0N5ACH8_9BILA